MSDRPQGGKKLGVDDISPPAAPPSEEPNELAREELARYEKAKRTPTDRLCAAHDGQIAHLRGENTRLREHAEELQRKLDILRPRYAELRQASKTNSLVEVVAVVGMAIGGGAISAASFFPIPEPFAHYCFGGGVVALFFGAGIMVYTRLLCWPSHHDDGV